MLQKPVGLVRITQIGRCNDHISNLGAIDVLCSTDGMRRVAVLGDMFELGEDSAEFHRALSHDPTLRRTLATESGARTALEIQRAHLEEIRAAVVAD